MARNRYLTRQGFRQFLVENEDEVVGFTRHHSECPIATYLGNVTMRTWHVSPLACVPQVDPEPGEDKFRLKSEFKTPKWAAEFIHNFDKHSPRGIVQEVTGADALYVLDEYA